MARKHRIINELQITDIVTEGKGLGRKDDMVIFVKDVVPGDVVDVIITKNKTSFKEGIVKQFIKYSDLRINAKCKHFELCGGCKWQNIEYEQQLKFKQKIVTDAFDRIAKTSINQVNNIIGSENIFYYRNKLEYTFSSRRWLYPDEMTDNRPESANGLGFHLPGMFDRVLDIEECLLQSELSNKILNKVKEFAISNNYEFYDTRNHKGFLRNLIIRNSVATDEIMVIMVFGDDEQEKINRILNHITEELPEVSSLFYIINKKTNDSYADLEPIHFNGKKYLTEKLRNIEFRIGPKSFFQTNTVQAKHMYDIAKEYADLKGNETVYDLFCGTGSIGIYLANSAAKVVGVEIIKEAIEDAKINAQINNIQNISFYSADIKDVLIDSFFEQNGMPDVVVFDPPRAGIHKDAIETIKKIKPKKIVYISCNPATQARDIEIFSDLYKVQKIQPVDMFPHTFHIENVALLELS